MSRLVSTKTALRAVVRDVSRQQQTPSFTRSFSSLPLLRPSSSPTTTATTSTSIFSNRPTTATTFNLVSPATGTATGEMAMVADVVPKTSLTLHPALCGLASQIRCGPRRHMNMNRPSRLIRVRRSGFLTRMRSKTGRKILKRRLSKGRKKLAW